MSSDWHIVETAIRRVEGSPFACACIGLPDEQGRCLCEQKFPTAWAVARLREQAEQQETTQSNLARQVVDAEARVAELEKALREIKTELRVFHRPPRPR